MTQRDMLIILIQTATQIVFASTSLMLQTPNISQKQLCTRNVEKHYSLDFSHNFPHTL